jgi:hypothetical protein
MGCILNMNKTYEKEYMITSSSKLNSCLTLIREITGKSNRQILEEIIVPLTEILGNKKAGNYYIAPQNDTITIQCYGQGNHVFSGKLTSTIDEITGVV